MQHALRVVTEEPRPPPGPNRRLALDGGFSRMPPRFPIEVQLTGTHGSGTYVHWSDEICDGLRFRRPNA